MAGNRVREDDGLNGESREQEDPEVHRGGRWWRGQGPDRRGEDGGLAGKMSGEIRWGSGKMVGGLPEKENSRRSWRKAGDGDGGGVGGRDDGGAAVRRWRQRKGSSGGGGLGTVASR